MKVTTLQQDEQFMRKEITIGKATVHGYELRVPQTDSWILLIQCGKGMLGCRLFDKDAAEKFHMPLALFSAAHVEALLDSKPVAISADMARLGIQEDMTGAEIVSWLSDADS